MAHVGVSTGAEALSYSAVKLFSKNSNLCDHDTWTSHTDRQTDGWTIYDRNTALCTKVHCAVKMRYFKGQMLFWIQTDCLRALETCISSFHCSYFAENCSITMNCIVLQLISVQNYVTVCWTPGGRRQTAFIRWVFYCICHQKSELIITWQLLIIFLHYWLIHLQFT